MGETFEKNPHVKARFSFVATKYRALRRITDSIEHIKPWPDGSFTISGKTVQLDCGHTYQGSLHHQHYTGDRAMCYRCGELAAMNLPEFAGYTTQELGIEEPTA